MMHATDPAQYEHFLPSPKWIRGLLGGRRVVDSRRAILARSAGKPPVYYFPRDDVDPDVLQESAPGPPRPVDPRTRYHDLVVGDRRIPAAAWEHAEGLPNAPQLRGYLAFQWSALDAWFEEDEEVLVHPRDPFVRVETLQSSRHVRVVVNGETLAETSCPVLLLETGLPTRYYLPKPHVRMDRLEASDHRTFCPYKGEARYYSVRMHGRHAQNIAWYYRYPRPEAAAVASLVCFYGERIEALYVDGEQTSGIGR